MIVDTSKLRKHNCADCVYIGSTAGADIYTHNHHIIARYGDEPWECASYLESELDKLLPDSNLLEELLFVRRPKQ